MQMTLKIGDARPHCCICMCVWIPKDPLSRQIRDSCGQVSSANGVCTHRESSQLTSSYFPIHSSTSSGAAFLLFAVHNVVVISMQQKQPTRLVLYATLACLLCHRNQTTKMRLQAIGSAIWRTRHGSLDSSLSTQFSCLFCMCMSLWLAVLPLCMLRGDILDPLALSCAAAIPYAFSSDTTTTAFAGQLRPVKPPDSDGRDPLPFHSRQPSTEIEQTPQDVMPLQ